MKKNNIIIIFAIIFAVFYFSEGISREMNFGDTVQIKGYCIVSVDKKVAKYMNNKEKKNNCYKNSFLIDYETEIFFYASNKTDTSKQDLKKIVLHGMNQLDSLFLFTRPSSWASTISEQCFQDVTEVASSCTSLFPSKFWRARKSKKLKSKRFGVLYVEATFLVLKENPCLKKLFEGFNSTLNNFNYVLVPITYVDVKEITCWTSR